MKNIDMNTVISWGLVIMGVLSVGGWIWISLQTGTSSGTEVPIAIISGLTGVLTGKNIAQNALYKNGGQPPQEPSNLPVRPPQEYMRAATEPREEWRFVDKENNGNAESGY